jgi:hypothetical protein
LTRLCANVRKQNTTTDTTTTAAQTTSNLPQKGKRKRKRKHNINPATCGYKDEGDDVQDYSSSGLKYNNNTTKIWRLNGEAVVDIEVVVTWFDVTYVRKGFLFGCACSHNIDVVKLLSYRFIFIFIIHLPSLFAFLLLLMINSIAVYHCRGITVV